MKCDPSMLWTLVEQSDIPSDQNDAIATHIETCVTCQNTLLQFGGDPTVWDEAREWLSVIDESSEPSRASDDSQWQPLPPIDLNFLETSSHPEMLGRIGRYDVESVLGRGGMGVVLRAYDSDLHRSVAVKVMAPEWAASMAARQRFAREAQAAASVAHENVIPIYNVQSDADLPFLVMRYIPGATLERWVKANGPLDVATILRVASQLAEGLAAAHKRGLVHRDIKPANVMVGENTDRVWITDFGLARAADSATLTQTGVIAGTPHYMSPEQARGEPIDQRTDLFSLGCVLYFLCTGRPPLEAENTLAVLHRIVSDDADLLTTKRDDLPPAFVSLVHRLLDRSPLKRPADCAQIIETLSVAQSEFSDGRTAKPPMSLRLRVGLVLLVACGAIALLASRFDRGKFNGSVERLGQPAAEHSGNPWASSDLDEEAASPYVARASEQIRQGVAMDAYQVDQQVHQLENEIRSLQRWPDQTVFPMMQQDTQWHQKVNKIESAIRNASR